MAPPVDGRADFKVHEIKTMGKSNDAEAKAILTRVTSQVQPIMRRRQWRVPLVSEFYPSNPALLGLNVGGGGGRTQQIKIRLRTPGSIDNFFPFEHILGTMLHELVHNVRGPHDNIFYKLLDELWDEVEELMDKGISGTGEGFDAPSMGRLGSHSFIPTHNPPEHRMREALLRAAEERAKKQRLMPRGPCRLGGDSRLSQQLTPAQAAARAAERRVRDNVWCPCELAGSQEDLEIMAADDAADSGGAGGGGKVSNVLAARPSSSAGAATAAAVAAAAAPPPPPDRHRPMSAAATAAAAAAALARSGSSSSAGGGAAAAAAAATAAAVGRRAAPTPGGAIDLTGDDEGGSSFSPVRTAVPDDAGVVSRSAGSSDRPWTCRACTLLNRPLALMCEACCSERPAEEGAGGAGGAGGSNAAAHPAGSGGSAVFPVRLAPGEWVCSTCTLVNDGAKILCTACGMPKC